MDAEVRKKKCSRSFFFLEKHWPHMISRLSLTTVTSLSEEHPVRNSSWGNCCAFKIHLLEPWLWLLFPYKHTHITSPTKSLQKHLPTFATRHKIFPLKQANSSLVHLRPAELLNFSSHFRLIFSFPKEQNILFPDVPEGSVFATSNRAHKPWRPLQKPIILSTAFLTATRGESLYTDSRALLLLESVHDFFKLLLHFISLKNS